MLFVLIFTLFYLPVHLGIPIRQAIVNVNSIQQTNLIVKSSEPHFIKTAQAVKFSLLPCLILLLCLFVNMKPDKTMVNKLMNISNDDTQNSLFCRLQLVD